MAVAPAQLTLEQFLEAPEGDTPLEFAKGVVTPKASPKGRHSALQAELLERLNAAGKPDQHVRAFPEVRTIFAGEARVPDIAVYRWERIPRDPDGKIANDFRSAPDIAIKIASPEQSVNGLVRKCLWYVENGVSLALLVDPGDESVLAFDANGNVQVWRGENRIELSSVIPVFALTVAELIDSLR